VVAVAKSGGPNQTLIPIYFKHKSLDESFKFMLDFDQNNFEGPIERIWAS
jgi:hypothetical protein